MESPSTSSSSRSPQSMEQQQQVSNLQDNTSSIAATNATSSSSTTSKYVHDFETLFMPIDVDKLRIKAQNGDLRHCQFRSLCWRYFLHCLPEQYDEWLNACKASRKSYREISERHLSSIKPKAIVSDSEDNQEQRQQSIRDQRNAQKTRDQQSSCDASDDEQEYTKASDECEYKNIFKTIERDVVRTFPDMEFFRQTEMQDILGNILFNFASENPHLSYKQGMHELLATLLYVAHTDSQNCLINYEGDYANEAIATLLDLKYLEHDVFHLFSSLMKSIESWYQNDEILIVPDTMPSSLNESAKVRLGSDNKKTSTSSMTTSTPRHQVSSVLGLKLKKISENIVRKYDLELFNHLEALQIAPQIYGIRWMRLLFGREYEFLDLLTVWDSIICDRDSMSLVDYVFASMLMTIRHELINGDYTDCLNNLMRHQFKDVPYVIRLALHLRDPVNNIRPKPQYRQYTSCISSSNSSSYAQSSGHSKLRQKASAATSSLTSKLSQQYLNDRFQMIGGPRASGINNQISGLQRFVQSSSSSDRSLSQQQMLDEKSNRMIFSMTAQDQKNRKFFQNKISTTLNDGINCLAQQSINRNVGSNLASGSKVGSKFLPNINKIVSSIGQNIQDKTLENGINSTLQRRQQSSSPRTAMAQHNNQQRSHQPSSYKSCPSSQNTQLQQQQFRQLPTGDLILSAGYHEQIKDFEMCEMQSSAGGGQQQQLAKRISLGQLSTGTSGGCSLDVSNVSYEDLPSIVDYCWRLLSEQIDSLQRCLPKEKSLHSEDEIFVALAQLKKVRDVLKGSLKLEDELESTGTTVAATAAAAGTLGKNP